MTANPAAPLLLALALMATVSAPATNETSASCRFNASAHLGLMLPPAARRALRSGGPLERDVEWRVPVGCDFSGFFVEVVCGYLPFLLAHGVRVHLLQERCPEHFLMHKLTQYEAAAYRVAQVAPDGPTARTQLQTAQSIAIEHAEPCKMRQYRGANKVHRPRYVISRSMSEGVLPAAEVQCANERADEIWVPTAYHKAIFKKSGISHRVRLTVIPESVDVSFFDRDAEELLAVACQPGALLIQSEEEKTKAKLRSDQKANRKSGTADAEAATLSEGAYIGELSSSPYCQRWLQPPPLWRKLPKAQNGLAAMLPSWRSATVATGGMLPLDRHREPKTGSSSSCSRSTKGSGATTPYTRSYAFVSVFKWEWRKGWDVLLNAYWSEFTASDAVVLRLRTFKPHWEGGHPNIIDWLKDAATQRGMTLEKLAPVEIIQRELSREELRWLYAASDAFVLPTRGEGWCLPAMEAMAMSLPVILTNASGTTEYLTRKNSIPLGYTSTHADGKVEPDVTQLKRLMRSVARYPGSAAKRGAQARQDVVENYHPHVVAAGLRARLKNIESALAAASE